MFFLVNALQWAKWKNPFKMKDESKEMFNIHYTAKSIGTPFFRTEKGTSKSVATTMGT